MKDSWILGLLGTIALCFMLGMVWQQREWVLRGANDFIPLSCGPRLMERGQLYDYKALEGEQVRYTGMYSETHGYIRLPFHAVLLWPLSRLPYPVAYGIWQALAIGSFVGFILLWKPPDAPKTFLWASLSMPAFVSLMRGQDLCFVLLIVAVSMWLVRRERWFLAGAIFSLCAVKFHLFLLLPIVLLAQRRWAFSKGLLAGGGVLAAVSFAAAGWRWPLEFVASATNPLFSPNVGQMPNVHGLLAGIPFDTAIEVAVGALIACGMWVVARRSSFSFAFAYALVGGLLLSHHAYMLDMAILLPACLTLSEESRWRWVRVAAMLLLLPPVHVAVEIGRPSSGVVVVLMLALVLLVVLEARASEQVSEQPLRELDGRQAAVPAP
jgi:Glycosyltransferase family 87